MIAKTTLGLMVTLGVTLLAQDLKFEVASVKPNHSGTNMVNFNLQPGGRFTGINVSVSDVLAIAFGESFPLPRNRIIGGPNWINAERFDLNAKADGDITNDQLRPMLRALLADRFQLVVHEESRERPIYGLVIARRDGRLGAGMQVTDRDCSGPRSANNPPPPDCARLNSLPGHLRLRGAQLAALARLLTGVVDDHNDVRDETGLTGTYDIDLTWTPSRPATPPPNASDDLVRALSSIDPNGPSLFTAIQEQLGLKLEPKKDSVNVVVIDRLEHPTPD